MKRKRTGILLSAVLTAAMILGTASVAAAAEPPVTETVYVTANAENGDQNVSVGDVDVTNGSGAVITSSDGKSATVTTGNVSSAESYGVESSISGAGSSVDVTVNGDINSYYDGLSLNPISEDYDNQGATVKATVTGSITSEYDDGIAAYSSSGMSTEITVGQEGGGNVTAIKADDDGITVGAYGSTGTTGGEAANAETSMKVTVNGDVEAGYWGISAGAGYGGKVDVTVNGDVTADRDGIDSESEGQNSITNITVNGNLTSNSDQYNDSAIDSFSEDGATENITINGNVSAMKGTLKEESGRGTSGISARAYMGSTENITVNGNVESNIHGVNLSAGSGGILFVSDDDPNAARETAVNLTIDGDLIAGVDGLSSSIFGKESTIDVLITGTISAGSVGVVTQGETTIKGYPGGIMPLGPGILLPSSDPVPDMPENYSTKNLTLTVWKIVPNEAGNVAEVENAEYDFSDIDSDSYYSNPTITQTRERNEELEKNIKYIIKLEDPHDGVSKLTATKSSGESLDKSHDYDIAYEGDKVLLKVDLKDGYRILAAYNGLGEKTPLLMDSDGNYYINVPKGGGVYLSVEVEKEKYNVSFVNDDGTELQSEIMEYGDTPSYEGQTPEKASTVQYDYKFIGWTPEINPVTGEITYTATYSETTRSYELSFDLGGGTFDGQSGSYTMLIEYGKTISLPIPTREGFTFDYWEGSKYAGGADYLVEGAHAFKAVWKENTPKDPDEPEDPEKESVPKPKKAAAKPAAANLAKAPQTGDDNNSVIWMIMMLFAGAAAAITACVKRTRVR